MKIVAVANQKGGQGKSSLAAHLAYAGVDRGLSVLVVDLDPQASVSGVSFGPRDGEAADALLASHLLFDDGAARKPAQIFDGLSVVRADKTRLSLPWLSHDLCDQAIRAFRKGVHALSSDYDLCVIDTPGSTSLNPPMTAAALAAAHGVVCPVAVGAYELDTLESLFSLQNAIRENGYNRSLKLLGLLPSRINTTRAGERADLQELRDQLGEFVLPHMLAERGAVKTAIAMRTPVWDKPKTGSHRLAAREWRDTCNYIIDRMLEL
jgi:chromosome partitioning protein